MLKEGWTNHTLGSNLKVLSLLRAAGTFCLQAEECSVFFCALGKHNLSWISSIKVEFLRNYLPPFWPGGSFGSVSDKSEVALCCWTYQMLTPIFCGLIDFLIPWQLKLPDNLDSLVWSDSSLQQEKRQWLCSSVPLSLPTCLFLILDWWHGSTT